MVKSFFQNSLFRAHLSRQRLDVSDTVQTEEVRAGKIYALSVNRTSSCVVLGAVAFGLLLVAEHNAVAENEVSTDEGIFSTDEGIYCSPTVDRRMAKDYRMRETSLLRGKAADTYRSHVGPAIRRMDAGIYSRSVIGDLNFTLKRWPNHYLALQALIRFEAGGGAVDKYIPVLCYFEKAHHFVPDDANVLVLAGLFRYKSGRDEAAKELWKFALRIDPKSVDAHYNLGLLYFRLGQYSASLEHARTAYELGYPLPGLRRMLIDGGYWN